MEGQYRAALEKSYPVERKIKEIAKDRLKASQSNYLLFMEMSAFYRAYGEAAAGLQKSENAETSHSEAYSKVMLMGASAADELNFPGLSNHLKQQIFLRQNDQAMNLVNENLGQILQGNPEANQEVLEALVAAEKCLSDYENAFQPEEFHYLMNKVLTQQSERRIVLSGNMFAMGRNAMSLGRTGHIIALSRFYASIWHAVEGDLVVHRGRDYLKTEIDSQETDGIRERYVELMNRLEKEVKTGSMNVPGAEEVFSKVACVVPLIEHYKNGDLESASKYVDIVEEGHKKALKTFGFEDELPIQRREYETQIFSELDPILMHGVP